MILQLIYIGLIFVNNQLVHSAPADSSKKKEETKSYPDFILLHKPHNSVMHSGPGYLYKTSSTNDKIWTFSSTDLTAEKFDRSTQIPDDNLSIIGQILQTFYQENTENDRRTCGHLLVSCTTKYKYNYILYNDKPPNRMPGSTLLRKKTTKNFGKGRGILIWDQEKVLWVLHSIAEYPLPLKGGKYEYPRHNNFFGQNLLILRLPANAIQTIIKHLMLMKAKVYDKQLDEGILGSIEDALFDDKIVEKSPIGSIYGTKSGASSRTSLSSGSSGFFSVKSSPLKIGAVNSRSSINEIRSRSSSISGNSINSNHMSTETKLLKKKKNSVSDLKTISGTNIKIITKYSKKSEELWSKVAENFPRTKFHIKSYFFSPDHRRIFGRSKCGNNNLVEILKLYIREDSVTGIANGLSDWSYTLDKSKFGICKDSPHCYCISSLNKNRGTNQKQYEKGIAVCLFDKQDETKVKNLNNAVGDSVYKLSCI